MPNELKCTSSGLTYSKSRRDQNQGFRDLTAFKSLFGLIAISCLQSSVFQLSMFGSTLDEIMEAQAKRFPSLKLPWILPTLAESVLQHQGASTEGIFR